MILAFEDFELDLCRVVLRRDGVEVPVEPQVFDLLRLLIDRRGAVVRKEELLDEVWGDRFVSESALTTRIKLARRTVGDDGARQRVIRTVHGKGYEFVAEVREIDVDVRPSGRTDRGAHRGIDALPAPPLQRLIGRDGLLAHLVDDQASNRLVTLVGPAGVGKTSVGYELARIALDAHADGVFVVELVTVVDSRATLGAFATALDVSTRQQAPIEEAIVDMLRPRCALLVLDNCEHVVETVAMLVDRILRSCPRVSIIATSREPLAVPGEHVWTVEPLAVPAPDVPFEELAAIPSIALFLERARAADLRFDLDSTTAPAVVEICRRLDGIPLAIELAAARASAIDVTEIAARLDERFRLLRAVRRGVDPRHQTLHDAVSWSYDLLDADEQRVFTLLAVFAGPFDLRAAESVCRNDDVLDLLTRLTQRSMLAVRRPSGGGIRYEMLETLREYGRNRMDAHQSGELFAAHAAHFSRLARSVEVDLCTTSESAAVMRTDASFADLRAAQRFAIETGDLDTGYTLIGSLREYAMRTLRYEVFNWADAAAGVAGGGDHALHPVITAVRAYGAWVRGEFELAVTLARSARAAEVASDVAPSGLVERVLANVLYATGEVETGLVEGARLIELAEDSGNDSRLAHAYYMASVASSSLGLYDEAHRLIDRARAAGRRTNGPTDLASASIAEGFAALDAHSAIHAFDTADRLARSAGNRWMSAFARTETSGLLVHLGNVDDGCRGLAEMVDVWYRAGEWAQQWHTLSRCLIALDRIDQPVVAAEVLGAIEAHATMGGPPVMTTLRDLAFAARDAVEERLGSAHTEQLRATGASLPVAAIVDRTCNALLGRSQNVL